MSNIMVDIETLGTTPGCVISSLAAIRFNLIDPNEEEYENNGDVFHESISIQKTLGVDLEINPNTVLWWLNQSKEAQEYFVKVQKIALPLSQVLTRFSLWLAKFHKMSPVVSLWGNSNRFDLGILEATYLRSNLPIPWDSRKERDLRTLVMLSPNDYHPSDYRDTIHDPIEDCKYQIKVAKTIYNKLKIN